MANARARLGKARRNIIKNKKTTDVVSGAIGALSTVAAFTGSQMKKADTAWKEYEAGYGEVPGADVADIKKPGLFKRTMQQLVPGGKTGLPQGDVRIGDTLYDRSKLQKAGSFLGSDASAILDEGAREQYLKRVAPGRDVSKMQMPTQAGATAQASGVVPTTPQFPTQDYNQNVVQKQKQGIYPGWMRDTKKTVQGMGQAGFGRFGDNAMKVIDGEPAHINKEIEGDMSPEDIKKYGAGTTNPITGKKEYFLGMVAGALAIGSSLYKGYQATKAGALVEDAKTAAGDLKQEQLDLLGDVRTQAITGATEQAQLGFDATQSQLGAGARESVMGARTGMRDIQAGTTAAASQSGLATSGTIQQKARIGAGDVTAKLKSDMTKIFETRELAEKERDLTIGTAKEKADLAYRSGEMSAEDAYQSTLTGLESQPTTFLEGMFS